MSHSKTRRDGTQTDHDSANALRNTPVGRRNFMRGSAMLMGGAAIASPLQLFMTRSARACGPIASPYGPIAPAPDQSTGLNLLQLPPDFKYWSFGWTGDPLSDGTATPALHDGMAVVRELGASGQLILCRNHEVGGGVPSFSAGPYQYSPDAGGGNTNVVWNTVTQELEESWASLSGTVRNCAGGVTPWNSWVSCEETFSSTDGGNFLHGYCFEIPANGKGANNAEPILEMGRFSHEALCVDPDTSIVYETEDGPSVRGDTGSGFYRFVPNKPRQLERGGRLQMLAIRGEPKKDMGPLTCSQTVVYSIEWVDVPNPNPTTASDLSCFRQGFDRGGASFRRLEGCWFGLGKVYFVSTTGGPISEGQVFEYDPQREELKLIYHAASQADCENPDNIVVTPNGGLILCEDNSGATSNDAERLLGLTLHGDIFTFAKNNINFTAAGLGNYTREESGSVYTQDFRQNEWAGACFNQVGDWLFVNIQTPGITFAITGPWARGPL
jgi:uncharacterized protein